jgi:hypothetical protein
MAALEYDPKDYKSKQRSGKQELVQSNAHVCMVTNLECRYMHDPCCDQFDKTAEDSPGIMACIEKSWSKGDGSDSMKYHSFDCQTTRHV